MGPSEKTRLQPAEVGISHGVLSGRVALITGAGRNIGRAISLRCGVEGAKVAVNDIDPAGAERVVGELRDFGADAYAVVGDMTEFDEVDRIFAEAEDHLGVVDLLVNNAYVRGADSNWGPFLAADARDWELFVKANMNLLFGCTQRAARALANESRPGTIVNVSSNGADRAHRNAIAYDSVKGAMDSFTRAVAVDLAPWGIRVNGLRPGSIAIEDDAIRWTNHPDLRSSQIPLGRVGVPDDIASCAVFLSSAESGYVTGQTFNVDGGLLAQGRAPQVEGFDVAGPSSLTVVPRTLLQ